MQRFLLVNFRFFVHVLGPIVRLHFRLRFVVLEEGHHVRELVPAATRRLFLVVKQERVELQHVVAADFFERLVANAVVEVAQRDVVGVVGFLLATVLDLREVLVYRHVQHQRLWLSLGRRRRPSAMQGQFTFDALASGVG